MKKQILTLAFSLIYYISPASSIQAILNNGSWTSNSTWSLNRTPVNGDTITIPVGVTVTINNNINMGSSTLYINVYGTLRFVGGGGKLTISGSSSVIVDAGGVINSTGSPSQTLQIGSNTVYQGNQVPVLGPEYANSTTGNGFLPFTALPVKFISFALTRQDNSILVQWS